MPYIKPHDPPFVKVKRLLLGYGLGVTELASVLDCSRNTAAARLNDPQRFTLGELNTISKRKHIPIDEIREAISA